MNDIQNILSSLFKNIAIDEKQKQVFVGIYLIGIYKVMLELLLATKNNDQKFILTLTTFFKEQIESLDDKQKKSFNEALEEQKNKLLTEMLNVCKNSLSLGDQKQLENNAKSLLTQTTST